MQGGCRLYINRVETSSVGDSRSTLAQTETEPACTHSQLNAVSCEICPTGPNRSIYSRRELLQLIILEALGSRIMHYILQDILALWTGPCRVFQLRHVCAMEQLIMTLDVYLRGNIECRRGGRMI